MIIGGLFQEIILRNQVLPTRKSRDFRVSKYQSQPIKLRVFEGMRKLAQDNRLLGEFGLPRVERGSKIAVQLWGSSMVI
jgi:molecular chaperone DnaK